MEENNNTLFTVTVYSENQVGLLNQISIIFTRRNLNIWSLTVSSTVLEGVHKFTIACRTSRRQIEAVVKQIEKRIDVIKAFYYTDDEIIYQEVALYKVPTDKILDDNDFESLLHRSNAQILEINRTFAVIQKTGHCDETKQLYEELSKYGVLQFVRSGRVAITRSTVEQVSRFLEAQEERREEIERK
ncbi:MAG: acetolactate synthase small subunit [Marinilabiliaceae bacterium]|nr:acetolactate synthase small subunit [Marinilabiliaceae bacterium]